MDGITDPMQWFGAGALLATGILSLLILVKIYRPDFLRTKSKLRLSFALFYLFAGLSAFFLAFARISFIEQNIDLGILFKYICTIWGTFAVLGWNFFAIYACFPQQIKKLGIVAIILNSIAIGTSISTFNSIQVGASYEIIFPPYYTMIAGTILGVVVFEIIAMFAYYSYSMRTKSRPHSQRAFWLAIAGVFNMVGYVPEVIEMGAIANYMRILFVCTVLLQYLVFTRFLELEWPTKVRHLYVIHQEDSIALYNYSFVKEEIADKNLVAGGISGTAMLIRELIRSPHQMKVIDLEKLKVLLEYGDYVLAALVTEENYRILRSKLGDFVQQFENVYKNELLNFTGAVNPFRPADSLVDQVFHYEKVF